MRELFDQDDFKENQAARINGGETYLRAGWRKANGRKIEKFQRVWKQVKRFPGKAGYP